MFSAVDIANKFLGWPSYLTPEFSMITELPKRVPSLIEAGNTFMVDYTTEKDLSLLAYNNVFALEPNRSAIYTELVKNMPAGYLSLFYDYMDKLFLNKDGVILLGNKNIKITKLFAVLDKIIKENKIQLTNSYPGNGPFSYAYEKSLGKLQASKLYIKQATTIEDYLLSPLLGEGVNSCHAATNRSDRRFGNWAHLVNPSVGHFYLTDNTFTDISGYALNKRLARCNVFAMWHVPTGKHVWLISREYSETKFAGILSSFLVKKAKEMGIYVMSRADCLETPSHTEYYLVGSPMITKNCPLHYPDSYEHVVYVNNYKTYLIYTDRLPKELPSKYDMPENKICIGSSKNIVYTDEIAPERINICAQCSKTLLERDMHRLGDYFFCKNCCSTCNNCKKVYRNDRQLIIDGKTYCDYCGKICGNCGAIGNWTNTYQKGLLPICFKCHASFRHCANCGSATIGKFIISNNILCVNCFASEEECLGCGNNVAQCSCIKTKEKVAIDTRDIFKISSSRPIRY